MALTGAVASSGSSVTVLAFTEAVSEASERVSDLTTLFLLMTTGVEPTDGPRAG